MYNMVVISKLVQLINLKELVIRKLVVNRRLVGELVVNRRLVGELVINRRLVGEPILLAIVLKLVPLFMEGVLPIFQLDNTQLFLRNDQLVRILHTYLNIPKGRIRFGIRWHSNQLRIFRVELLF